jgi:hypothetical protein
MGNPLLLEDVLIRHPKLRIYVMHFGSPFVDDMIALLYSYPQVYVDVAQNDWGFPRKHFHAQLRRLVEAGFGKRSLIQSEPAISVRTKPVARDDSGRLVSNSYFGITSVLPVTRQMEIPHLRAIGDRSANLRASH